MSEGGTTEKLVYMANQIASFFRSQGHGDESEPVRVLGVADHVRSFWDPRMRRMIFEHLEHGGEGLTPLARAGIEMLRDGATPQSLHAAAVAAGSHTPGPSQGDDAG